MENKRIIVINSENQETRVALLNNNCLEEYQVERDHSENIVGSVFLGKVVNIQHSLRAVFVDIGLAKNAFMHFSDMIPASYEETNIRTKEEKSNAQRINLSDIPKLFPVGATLFVQITKGPIGTKGPRATTNISIPGRYLVLMPYSDHVGISKRIEDSRERKRLRGIMSGLNIAEGMGCICRTVGEGRKSVFFKRDINMLMEYWNKVEKAKKISRKPRVVYKELSLLEKSMRDFLTENIDEVIIDDPSDFSYIKDFMSKLAPQKMINRIKLYQKATPIFEYYDVKDKVARIFERQVSLPSGGYICIDETEALIAVDVNTGSSKSNGNMEDIILITNLEAADELARQLRLRNIGGLLVIDFIDMSNYKDNDKVLKRMRKQLKNDRAKTRVLPISHLGLMQMTRQRDQQSLLDKVYDPCPYCNGKGKVKSPLTTSVEIQRLLKEILKRKQWDKELEVRVIMNPVVMARLKNDDAAFLSELEDKYGRCLSFRGDTLAHIEEFRIIDAKTEKDLLY
jgi:Rne/Rng family ribonuclease